MVAGCSGYGSATVAVDITATWRADLVVTLVAQDGSTYLLHNRTGGGTDDVKATFTVNLASTAANGTWRLRVTDQAAPDVGTLNSWALNTGGGGAPVSPCRATNGTDFSIQDNTTVESPITIAGCAGNAPVTSIVEVHIVHTYQGDLAVTLIAPDGSSYVLHNRTGGDARQHRPDVRSRPHAAPGARGGSARGCSGSARGSERFWRDSRPRRGSGR